MKPLLVYGSREFAVVIRDLVGQCGRTFAGFIDDFQSGADILGSLSEVAERCPPATHDMALAVGYNNLPARWDAYLRVKACGYDLPPLIHPRAYVRNPEKVGEGSLIMAGAIVDINAELGPLTVLWPGVVVNHDSSVAANTFLSPNCTVCGFVKIGANAFIGAGATIVDHVTVPAGSFVKAGALFTARSVTGTPT